MFGWMFSKPLRALRKLAPVLMAIRRHDVAADGSRDPAHLGGRCRSGKLDHSSLPRIWISLVMWHEGFHHALVRLQIVDDHLFELVREERPVGHGGGFDLDSANGLRL